MAFRLLIVAAALFLGFSARGDLPRLDPKFPTLVVTDSMPDDWFAYVRLGQLFAPTRGENLVIVTNDGLTETKATALHTFIHFFGLTRVRVLAGNPNTIDAADPHAIEYVRSYDVEELRAYLDVLATNAEPKPWVNHEYRDYLTRWIARNRNIQVLLIANASSFVDVLPTADPKHFRVWYANCLHKLMGDGTIITSFNSNGNIRATEALLAYQRRHRIPMLDVPSNFFTELAAVERSAVDNRNLLLRNTSHGNVLSDLDRALERYVWALQDVLVRRYSTLAPFLSLFQPSQGGWNQDLGLVVIAENPDLLTRSHPISLTLDLSVKEPRGLGFPVTTKPAEGTNHFLVTELKVDKVADAVAQSFAQAQVVPHFSAARVLGQRRHRAAILVLKGSLDDEGALMAAVALGDVRLVITESSRAAELAERYRRTLRAYGRQDIPVVAGRGHTWDEMAADEALKLELAIARKGGLSVGLLTDVERQAFQAVEPLPATAADAAIAILEKTEKVNWLDTASGHTLYEVLRRRPDLAVKFAETHLMGGFRGAKKLGANYSDGIVTRCWLDHALQAKLFALLDSNRMPTWVYSSHHSGGNATTRLMPKYAAALLELERKFPVADKQKAMRRFWLQELATMMEGRMTIDVDGGLGPPLGYLMAARMLLGAEAAEGYFGATRGTFTFHDGKKVDFVADEGSSIAMLDEFKRFGPLDETMAYAMETLARGNRGSLWNQALDFCGRILGRR